MSQSLTYQLSGGTSETINLVKDLSVVRFKNHEHTDSQGYVKGYICDVSIVAGAYQSAVIYSVPNHWKMRNAFRKWHAYRNKMFKDSGVTRSEMGKYGQTIRPYLNDAHIARPELRPLLVGSAPAVGGEWTYTTMASSPAWDADGTGAGGIALVDTYSLSVLDDNTVTSTASGQETTSFSNCGMIHCYNLDRMSEVTPASTETLSGPNNPLAMIRSGSPATGEIIDLAEDQELEATPYDISRDGDSISAEFSEYFRCVPHVSQNTTFDDAGAVVDNATVNPGVGHLRGIFVPAGMFQIFCAQSEDTIVTVNVLAEVLCKDMDRDI